MCIRIYSREDGGQIRGVDGRGTEMSECQLAGKKEILKRDLDILFCYCHQRPLTQKQTVGRWFQVQPSLQLQRQQHWGASRKHKLEQQLAKRVFITHEFSEAAEFSDTTGPPSLRMSAISPTSAIELHHLKYLPMWMASRYIANYNNGGCNTIACVSSYYIHVLFTRMCYKSSTTYWP